MDCSPPGSSVHGDSPDKNTRVGCHALLQGIFLIQESNWSLMHCRWIFFFLPAELQHRTLLFKTDQPKQIPHWSSTIWKGRWTGAGVGWGMGGIDEIWRTLLGLMTEYCLTNALTTGFLKSALVLKLPYLPCSSAHKWNSQGWLVSVSLTSGY